MNLDDLLQAVQKLLSADSPKAVVQVIQSHPDLLKEETIDQLHQLAQIAKAVGHTEFAEALSAVAEMLEQLQRELLPSQLSEAESKPTISPKPSVQWARLTRQYLALRKRELLQQAVKTAEQAGEKSIANLLRAFQARDIETIERLAPDLHRALLQARREEEAWTVALVHLDIRARLTEQFMYFPLEQQMEALKVGLKACEH